jgi:nucleoside-diphosphate-sugar epimerase
MARVLVSGAGGFLGLHVMQALRLAGHDASPLSSRGEAAFDVRDAHSVERAVQAGAPEAFIHLAGTTRGGDEHIHEVNVAGTRRLLEAVSRCAPRCHVLLCGSAAEYGTAAHAGLLDETSPCAPVNAYGHSKLAATRLGQDFALSDRVPAVTIVRLFNVVGAGMPEHLFVGAVLKRIRAALQPGAAREIVVGNVDVERDYVAAEDVADAMVRLVPRPTRGEIFNLCSGRGVTIRHLLDTLLAMAPEPIAWRQDPALIRPDDIARSVGSWRKAAAAFGFEPRIPLDQSLRSAWTHHFDEESTA